jgi:TetR/AcrR family transcriptional regulator, tetracycline repressor protein
MQLTRARIIGAAIGLIEAEGPAAVSMPRLAAELGCGLMSLYGRVSSRDALLDTVAADLIARIEVPVLPGASWPDLLRSHAHAIRRVAAAYPSTAVMAATRGPAAAALPQLAGNVLAALESSGLTGPDQVRVLRTLSAYVLGSLLREASAGDAGSRTAARGMRASGSTANCAADADMRALQADAEFEFGLDLLVGAVAALCPATPGPATPSPAVPCQAVPCQATPSPVPCSAS